jgi:hypothetical protein
LLIITFLVSFFPSKILIPREQNCVLLVIMAPGLRTMPLI